MLLDKFQEAGEKAGLSRVMEALECNMWSSMQRKGMFLD